MWCVGGGCWLLRIDKNTVSQTDCCLALAQFEEALGPGRWMTVLGGPGLWQAGLVFTTSLSSHKQQHLQGTRQAGQRGSTCVN